MCLLGAVSERVAVGCCAILRMVGSWGARRRSEELLAAGCRFGATGGRPAVGVGMGKLYAQVGRDHSHMHLCY